MSIVAYLGHALGEKDLVDAWDDSQGTNVSNSLDWLKFLRAATDWVVCYPTIAFVAALAESAHQPRSFTDRIQIMLRCDLYVLTGGKLAPHMVYEADTARRKPMAVMDLLYLGKFPPWDRVDAVSKEIERLEASLGL
jgi:hypothetical protein